MVEAVVVEAVEVVVVWWVVVLVVVVVVVVCRQKAVEINSYQRKRCKQVRTRQ